MILRALELRDALDVYAAKLSVSKDVLDVETFQNDYLSQDKWETLAVIKDHLEPLFLLTKSLEGNVDLTDGAGRVSHSALWEILPVFDHILAHFENLEECSIIIRRVIKHEIAKVLRGNTESD